MTERGIFLPDGSFRDEHEIRRNVLADHLRGTSEVIGRSELPAPIDFDDWTDQLISEQRAWRERFGIPEAIEVEIATTGPVPVALFGDVHAAQREVDFDRFRKDINITSDIDGYSLLFGDLTDSGFWMPSAQEQLTGNEEAVYYMQAALDKLGKEGRILAAWGGDHDVWQYDRMGSHAMYQKFGERYGAHYLEGVSYVTIWLNTGDKRVPFYITGSHRHKGFSVYNDAHASLRQFRDEGIEGTADHVVSVTAHNHVKAHLRQTHKVFGGREVISHSIALGTYKASDRYTRKMGWARKDDKSIGAFGLILNPDDRSVDVCWTLQELSKRLGY